MSVAHYFDTMDYGPAPESDGEARAWLTKHDKGLMYGRVPTDAGDRVLATTKATAAQFSQRLKALAMMEGVQ